MKTFDFHKGRTVSKSKRCENCLGMGYKGRTVRGKWKICTCTSCRGSGSVPESMRQRSR